jgi:hypothetical protein
MNCRANRKSIMHSPQRRVDSMGSDRMQDDDSVATTMGVRPTTMPMDAINSAPNEPPVCSPFVIPKRLPGTATGDDDDDDISVLTEFSLMDDEEDSLSQVTTWTVVTTGTDSTTLPRRNSVPVQPKSATKRRHATISLKVPHDNSSFKRRRRR